MTIPTQMSLHGFIATQPELTFGDTGVARFRARVGVEHFRKESDGGFTKLEPSFHDLVMVNATAVRAYARFRTGDQFVASGYIHEYDLERNGQAEPREEFVARRIGHDTARTHYQVDRTPARASDPPGQPPSAPQEPVEAVGL